MSQRCLLAFTVSIFSITYHQRDEMNLVRLIFPISSQYLRSMLLLRRWQRRFLALALRRPLLLLYLLFLFLPGSLRSTRCLRGNDRTLRLRLGLNLRLKLSLWLQLKLKLRYSFHVGRRRVPCRNLGFSLGRRFRHIPVGSKTQNIHISIKREGRDTTGHGSIVGMGEFGGFISRLYENHLRRPNNNTVR